MYEFNRTVYEYGTDPLGDVAPVVMITGLIKKPPAPIERVWLPNGKNRAQKKGCVSGHKEPEVQDAQQNAGWKLFCRVLSGHIRLSVYPVRFCADMHVRTRSK